MPQGYHHLTYEQRCQISILKESGFSRRAIASTLNVHRTTISRELKRNGEHHEYCHSQAQKKSSNRKIHQPNKKMTPPLIATIEAMLKQQWSPAQISGRIKQQYGTDISYETIYKYVWADKRYGGFLYKDLRHCGKKYNKRSKGTAGRGCIPGRIDIDERPAIVKEKTRLGDWELDTIVGTDQSGAIVSMVERTSKLTKLSKVSRKTAEEVRGAILERLRPIEELVFTLTADNGKEFADHQKIGLELGAGFYFAKPYHSWE